MAIKHAFTSGKPASADPTLVDGPDWDSNHVIDAGTITLAQIANVATARFLGRNTAGAGVLEELTVATAKTMLAIAAGDLNFVATQRVLGRNTAGAGAGEEVTATQILDWIASTNGSMLTRSGGVWAPLARVTTDGNDMLFTSVRGPLQSGAGFAKLHSETLAAREMFGCLSGHIADGIPTYQFQPFFGRRHMSLWTPRGAGSSAIDTFGMVPPTFVGTATGRAFATTSVLTHSARVAAVSAAGAGSVAALYTGNDYWWRGDAAFKGGFHLVFKFAISDAVLVGTGRTFVGAYSGGAAPTDVEPSTLTNLIGVGNNNGDTNMQLYASGAAAQARIDLGANFPAQTTNTDVYELHLFCAPNGSRVGYTVIRVNTNHIVSGSVTAAASLFNGSIGPIFRRTNGGTASAVGIDILGFYSETDN